MNDITPDQISLKGRSHTAQEIDGMKTVVYAVNKQNGWFDNDRSFGDEIALLHSELSEALEAFRIEGMTTDQTSAFCKVEDSEHIWSIDQRLPEGKNAHYCKPEGVGSELADVLVRLLDVSHRYNINLVDEFWRKVRYNATRGHRHGNKSL